MRSVIVVDDDPDIRAIAEMSLSMVGGVQVRVAESGSAALDLLLEAVPDVVMLDVMMPGIDGVETLRRIRLRPDLDGLPVIFMTARIQPQDLDAYLRAGSAGVVAKPFDPMTLPDDVRQLVDAARRQPRRADR